MFLVGFAAILGQSIGRHMLEIALKHGKHTHTVIDLNITSATQTQLTGIPKIQPVPAGFSLVMPQRLHTWPLFATAHTSFLPTDTDRKPIAPPVPASACGPSPATFGSTVQWVPSGNVEVTSRLTTRRPSASSAQTPKRPALICRRVAPPGGASTGCHESPCGFCAVTPYRTYVLPVLLTTHTRFSAAPQQIDTSG